MWGWIKQIGRPPTADERLVKRLTRLAIKEANVIDDLFTKHGIAASVDRSKVQGSDTGGFTRYPLRNDGKVSAISNVMTDLAVCLSAHRDTEVTPKLHLPRLVLELPYPLERQPLAWQHAPINQLQEYQAIVGMDYSTLNVKPIVLDWQKAASSNLLVSGETGSGKTNALLGIIISLAMSTSPDRAQIIIFDPKFSPSIQQLRGLPHVAVHNEPADIADALTAVKAELERRKRQPDKRKLFLIVEEISELMIETDRDSKQTLMEQLISIAQVGRELNVHIIACTQKAVVSVVNTVLRANLPARLAFKVGTSEESKVALGQDGVGAESLPGLGAAYYVHNGPARRIQTYLIEDVQACVEDVAEKWDSIAPYQLTTDAPQAPSGLPDGVTQDQLDMLLDAYPIEDWLDSSKSYDWRYGYRKKAIRIVFGENANTGGTTHDWTKRVLQVLQSRVMA